MSITTDARRKRFDVIVSRAAGASSDARLTITTQHEDREGDILIPEGAVLDAYRKNPVVLFSHDHYSIPVGRTVSLDVVPGEGIRADFVWLKNDPDADRIRNAFEQGVLNAASVGFRPLKWNQLGNGGYRYTQWELLEWSIVAVPANAEAVRHLKSLGLYSDDIVAVEFIKQLAQAGVEIFEYVHGQSLTPKSPTAKLLSSVQGFADEDHAVKTSERVIEAHTRLFEMGRVVGGRIFGYDNRHIFNGVDASGNPRRSHTERVTNETQAAVVRRIFALYDAGEGLKRIAMRLNSEGATCPKKFVRKDQTKVQPVEGWAPGTIRAILRREIYGGTVVWNKSRKRDDFRQVNQRPRPESEWLRQDAPHLRIIDTALWRRVESRRREAETLTARMAGGRLSGRPPKTATQNLLAGLATCAVCGGSLTVETSPRKRGRVPEYICYRRRANGGCTNTLRMPVVELNEAVLQAIEAHALTPEAIEQVIHLSERDDVTELQEKLARERKTIEKKIARLVEAIEAAGDVTSLADKLRELEARRKAIDKEARNLRPVPRLAPAVIESRLAEWRKLLRGSTTQGRTVLQRILRGRLTFTPRSDGRGYDFMGPTRFDKLFTGVTCPPAPAWLAPGDRRGLEDTTPEDTFDGDYGRVLDRAYEKSVKASAAAQERASSPGRDASKGVEVMASPWGRHFHRGHSGDMGDTLFWSPRGNDGFRSVTTLAAAGAQRR